MHATASSRTQPQRNGNSRRTPFGAPILLRRRYLGTLGALLSIALIVGCARQYHWYECTNVGAVASTTTIARPVRSRIRPTTAARHRSPSRTVSRQASRLPGRSHRRTRPMPHPMPQRSPRARDAEPTRPGLCCPIEVCAPFAGNTATSHEAATRSRRTKPARRRWLSPVSLSTRQCVGHRGPINRTSLSSSLGSSL